MGPACASCSRSNNTRRDDADAIAPGIGAVLVLLGCSLAAFEANQAFALLRAMVTGALYGSFWRGRILAHHWDVQPGSFLLQASVGLAEILVAGLGQPATGAGGTAANAAGEKTRTARPSAPQPSRRIRGRNCTTTS